MSSQDTKKGKEEILVEEAFDFSSDKDTHSDVFYYENKLSDSLKSRHLSMLALVGVFGTGIFLSSGSTLSNSGPVGMLIAFLFVGSVVGMNQLAITENACLMPSTAGIVNHSEHFFDDAWGFVMGWVGVYGAIIPSELTATAVVVSYWTDLSPAIFITIFIVEILAINSWNVKWYGEIEFWFGILKVCLILALILSGLILDLGGVKGQERLGFHYWKHPGPFAEKFATGSLGRFLGVWKAISSVVYSYGGVQTMIIVFAGEAQYPRRTIYRASKRIFFRAFTLYISIVFILSLIVAHDNPRIATGAGNASSSPFVVAMSNAGVKVFPDIINAVVLTSALSAANLGIAEGSRNLYALASKKQAPLIFLKVNRNKLPYVASITIAAFLPLAYMTVSLAAANVFGWFSSITSSYLLLKWITISVNNIQLNRAIKVQGYSRSDLPYSFKIGPFAAWYSLFWSVIFLLTGGFSTFIHGRWAWSTFVSSYLIIPLSLVLYVGFKLVKKTKIKRPEDINLKVLFQHVIDHPEPEYPKKKGWEYITCLWD